MSMTREDEMALMRPSQPSGGVAKLNCQTVHLKPAQAAAMLSISRSTFDRWMNAGTIPAVKMGARTRFKTSDLAKLVAALFRGRWSGRGRQGHQLHPVTSMGGGDWPGTRTLFPLVLDVAHSIRRCLRNHRTDAFLQRWRHPLPFSDNLGQVLGHVAPRKVDTYGTLFVHSFVLSMLWKCTDLSSEAFGGTL